MNIAPVVCAFVIVSAMGHTQSSFWGPPAPYGKQRAVCVIKGGAGVDGVIQFEQDHPRAETCISGEIRGLSPGQHGFHVHQFGDSTKGCVSAGPHYNPYHQTHGGPQDTIRHVGDLGNIYADENGVAKISTRDRQISLGGHYSVVGRAVVVHAGQDDLGRGVGEKREESLKTGNAGARLGCGVIAWAKPDYA